MSDLKKQFPKIYDFFNNDEYRANVLINKYLLRDSQGNFLEHTVEEVCQRVAKSLAKHSQDEKKWTDIFLKAINNFKGVVPQGSVLAAIGNEEQLQSLSNCFVVPSPSDTIAGIMQSNERMAQIFKRRGGVGVDLSSLRPDGAIVKNAALKSSGAWGWAEHYSNTCRDVAQAGRRGALMLTLNIKHPDAEKWATMKDDLTKVTGANVSLFITDEFMKAVEKDGEFIQQYPVDSDTPIISKKIKARELWDVICKQAHKTAEPGILMWDNITETLPAHCYEEFKVTSTNPCITSDTWILTDKGPKQVLDLIGIKFNAIMDGKAYPSTDRGFFHTGHKKVFKLTTKEGFVIKLTDNHQLKRVERTGSHASQDWITVAQLVPGDKILLSNNRGYLWETDDGNFAEGWLLGNLKGDGCNSSAQSYLTYWGQNKNDMLSHAISMLHKSGLKYRSDCGNAILNPNNENRTSIGLHSSSLYKLAEKYGMDDVKKTLSEKIEKTSGAFHLGFIQGWFDADGTVIGCHKKGISVRCSSIDLNGLEILQRMLARFGIISTIYKNRQSSGYKDMPDGKGGSKPYFCQSLHELCIARNNVVEFAKIIGFSDQNKNNKLKQLLNGYKRNPNKELFVATVDSIIEIEHQDVYDCTIPDTSCFDANGIVSHNCSELPLSDHDSCRLITICLTNYVENAFADNAKFNFDRFEADIRTCVRMGECLVSAEIEHVDRILEKVKREQRKASAKNKHEYDIEIDLWEKIRKAAVNGRRLGLGDHGLGDCLTMLCLKYDSDEAIKMAGKIKKFYRDIAYDESVELAKELGPFPIWDNKIEKECKFFQTFPKDLLAKMKKYGRRHVSLLTNAPTGSISTLSGTSSGIEPTFRFCYSRRRKLNASDPHSKVDFVDQNGDKWQNYIICEPIIRKYFETQGIQMSDITSDTELMKKLPSYFITSDKISWIKRVEMQAILTKYTDHSLSSTINLPEHVSVDVVKEIYTEAWKKGCKGITIYRENCRTGVLNSLESANSISRPSTILRQEAPERPKSLPCEVTITKVEGIEYVVIISFLGDSVYEVFAGEHNNCLPEHSFSAEVLKKKESTYILKYVDGDKTKEVDINKYFKNASYQAITRLVSTSLRHGTPIAFVVEQLSKSSEALTGFEKSLARVLKKYAKKEDMARKIVANTTDDIEIKFEDGCMTIINHTKNTIESKCN